MKSEVTYVISFHDHTKDLPEFKFSIHVLVSHRNICMTLISEVTHGHTNDLIELKIWYANILYASMGR